MRLRALIQATAAAGVMPALCHMQADHACGLKCVLLPTDKSKEREVKCMVTTLFCKTASKAKSGAREPECL